MMKSTLPLFLAAALMSPMGAVMAADNVDDITMQVIEDESAKGIKQQIALPVMEQERVRERVRNRTNQAENEDAAREQNQEMREEHTQNQQQMRDAASAPRGR